MTPEEKYERLRKDYNDFVYIVSHDFKAVFRKLSSLTAWISEDLDDGELDEVRNHVKMIQESSRHMDGMLDGVTWLSRVDRIEEQPENHSINDLIKEVQEEFPHTKNLNITSDGIPEIISPKEKIFKVVREIIKNAETYNNSEEKTLTISFEKGDKSSAIHFKDNGIGITNKDIDAPFKLFYTEKFKTGIVSTGYGLTYARKLAESEDGNVVISESTENKGTTVSVFWSNEKLKL